MTAEKQWAELMCVPAAFVEKGLWYFKYCIHYFLLSATTTDQSVSPLSSSPGTPSECVSTDDVDDLEVDEVKNLSDLKNAGKLL